MISPLPTRVPDVLVQTTSRMTSLLRLTIGARMNVVIAARVPIVQCRRGMAERNLQGFVPPV